MDTDEARTIGLRLQRVRHARGRSLRVVAGLAGISASTLLRIEHGERAVTVAEIAALATALEIAPSELTRLPVPAPANGHADSGTEDVRLALDAVEAGYPDGAALPTKTLREQVSRVRRELQTCQFAEVGRALPVLIRDLHTAVATGADHNELLESAVFLHVHVTRLWLSHAGAPDDLVRRAVFLAQRIAQERDAVTTLAVAGFGVANVLLHHGSLATGRAALDAITLPPTSAANGGLVGELASLRAELAVLSGRPADAVAPLEAATQIAERFGTGGRVDATGLLYSPTHAGMSRMWVAFEAGEPDQGAVVAETLCPEDLPFSMNQSHYWMSYGRALAQLPGRSDAAVWALRTAEDIYPTKVHRNPWVREAIATLLPGAGRDAAGVELRGMAHRAGLPV